MPRRPQIDRSLRELIHPFVGAIDVSERAPQLSDDGAAHHCQAFDRYRRLEHFGLLKQKACSCSTTCG